MEIHFAHRLRIGYTTNRRVGEEPSPSCIQRRNKSDLNYIKTGKWSCWEKRNIQNEQKHIYTLARSWFPRLRTFFFYKFATEPRSRVTSRRTVNFGTYIIKNNSGATQPKTNLDVVVSCWIEWIKMRVGYQNDKNSVINRMP